MENRHLLFGAVLCLTGCPAGTQNDHYRPHGHQDTTFDIAPADDFIVFNASGAGGRDLYLLRLSDRSVSRIAESPDYEVTPAFSPDGSSVTYAAGVPGDKADHIFTIHLDGSGKTQLTAAKANDTDPSYSPDGTMITFARDKTYVWGGLSSNWDNGGVICVVNSDGTNERQLTPDDEFAYAPYFSSDGKRVIYSTPSGLYSVPLTARSAPTRLGPAGTHLAVASDGKSVVFADGQYSPDYELFVSAFDGTQQLQITNSENGCFHPVFVSTNDRVFFLMEEWPNGPTGHPKSSLWSVTTEGKEQKPVTDMSLFDDPIDWRPKPSP